MKKPSLAEAMQLHDTKPNFQTVLETPNKKLHNGVQPGRIGKKQVLGYFSAECKKQLKQMAVDQDKTEQEFLTEALNLLFTKYGKPTIA